MLPNPALEPAANWVPPIVSLALAIIFGVLLTRTLLRRFETLEAKVEKLTGIVQDQITKATSYLTHEQNSKIAKEQWEVIRRVEKQQYAHQQVMLDRSKRGQRGGDDEG